MIELPYSQDAEWAVLGALLFDNSRINDVLAVLSPHGDEFFRVQHRDIFRAITGLLDAGQPADVITVAEVLDKQGKLDQIGGLAYLADMTSNTPSAANVKAYAAIVADRASRRTFINQMKAVMDKMARVGIETVDEVLSEADGVVSQIAEKTGRTTGMTHIKSSLLKVVEQIDERLGSDNPINGVPTGFQDFDEMTNGLQPADMIILAGRPSMGKTTLAMNIAEFAAVHKQLPTLVFSMEMPAEQLAYRMLSSNSRVEMKRLRRAELDDDDWPRITCATGMLADSPIYIDDTPALTPGELRARARRAHRDHKIGLIVIDYLQLMGLGKKTENRTQEVGEISRGIKALAKELGVPIIVLSQLNRSLEKRTDKRPMMSDLRESGSIEQDADVIVFIYRDEVYNSDSPDKGTAEVIIGKQRNGEIGMVRVAFQGHISKFANFARHDHGYS